MPGSLPNGTIFNMRSRPTETFAKRSILFKVKEDEDFNRRNTLSILSPPQADESDAEIGQRGYAKVSTGEPVRQLDVVICLLHASPL